MKEQSIKGINDEEMVYDILDELGEAMAGDIFKQEEVEYLLGNKYPDEGEVTFADFIRLYLEMLSEYGESFASKMLAESQVDRYAVKVHSFLDIIYKTINETMGLAKLTSLNYGAFRRVARARYVNRHSGVVVEPIERGSSHRSRKLNSITVGKCILTWHRLTRESWVPGKEQSSYYSANMRANYLSAIQEILVPLAEAFC